MHFVDKKINIINMRIDNIIEGVSRQMDKLSIPEISIGWFDENQNICNINRLRERLT